MLRRHIAAPRGYKKHGRFYIPSVITRAPTGGGGGTDTQWDSTNVGSNVTLSNGNLSALGDSGSSNNGGTVSSVGATTGKYYAEITIDAVSTAGGAADPYIGVVDNTWDPDSLNLSTGANTSFQGRFNNAIGGNYSLGGFGAGDVIGIAFDADTREVWYRKNGGGWAGSGDPETGANPQKTITGSGLLHFAAWNGWSSQVTVNFGDGGFAAPPPTGFSPI